MKGNQQFKQALEDAYQICLGLGAVEAVEASTPGGDAADAAADMRLAMAGRGYNAPTSAEVDQSVPPAPPAAN
jgi:hypothetical protein